MTRATNLIAAALYLASSVGLCLAGAVDRDVAEWTILKGGRVVTSAAPGFVSNLDELPASDFSLIGVDLYGAVIFPHDLRRLQGLTSLEELYLPSPMWNRNTDKGLNRSGELGLLRGLTSLERLVLSFHFMDEVRLNDDGVEKIAGLTGLKELALAQSFITGATLATIPQSGDARRLADSVER